MHEHSLINNLIQKIEQIAVEQAPLQLHTVTLQLGALAHISAEHLRQHFQQATHGTELTEVDLIIQTDTDIHSPTAQDILLKSVDVREAE